MQKILFTSLFVIFSLFMGCKGETGPQGPAGPAGSQGSTGSQGPAGPSGPQGTSGSVGSTGPQGPIGFPGQNASQPVVYDFTVDLSKALPMWNFPKTLGAYDLPFVYIMVNKGSGYTMLPFRGFAYTSDQKDFIKLDTYVTNYDFFLSFRSETSVPPGATFWFRTVVLKGAKGGRIDMSRYKDYENLRRDYNLPD